MRANRRMSQECADRFDHPDIEDVFETARRRFIRLLFQPEHIAEQPLRQAVAADDLRRPLAALVGQREFVAVFGDIPLGNHLPDNLIKP